MSGLQLRRWHFFYYWRWHLTHHPIKATPDFVRWAWKTRFGRTVRKKWAA